MTAPPKSKYYNCRFLVISQNTKLREFLENMFDNLQVVCKTFANSTRHARKALIDGISHQLPFHFIIIDFQKMSLSEKEETYRLYELWRSDDKYMNIPILILKEVEEEVVGDENNEDGEEESKLSSEEEQGEEQSGEQSEEQPQVDEETKQKIENPQQASQSESEKGHEVMLDTNQPNFDGDLLTEAVSRPLEVDNIIMALDLLYKCAYSQDLHLIGVENKGKYQIINLPASIDEAVMNELKFIGGQFVGAPPQMVVFNFQMLTNAAFEQVRMIFQILFSLKEKEVPFCSIGMEARLEILINNKGLAKSFRIEKSLKGALTRAGISMTQKACKYPSIDVKIINPFIMATILFFSEHLKISLRPEPPDMNNDYDFQDAAFATVIAVESLTFNGTISQIYSKEVFSNFFKKIAKEKNIVAVDEALDFTNNMLHAIFERAKIILVKEHNQTLDQVTPKVLHGYDKIYAELPKTISIRVPLTSDIGTFSLLINGKVN